MTNGMACYNHPLRQAVSQCNGCKKGICKECYDITGSWCCDCVMEMSDTTTGNVEVLADRFSREKKGIKIFSIIGAVIGLIVGIVNASQVPSSADMVVMVIGPTWVVAGIGAALAWFFFRVIFIFKNTMSERGFGEAVKTVLIVGVFLGIIGMFTGPIFILVTILRRNSWIKKCEKIYIEEKESLETLRNVLAGRQANTENVNALVRQIVDNFQVARNGVWIDDLKKLKTRGGV